MNRLPKSILTFACTFLYPREIRSVLLLSKTVNKNFDLDLFMEFFYDFLVSVKRRIIHLDFLICKTKDTSKNGTKTSKLDLQNFTSTVSTHLEIREEIKIVFEKWRLMCGLYGRNLRYINNYLNVNMYCGLCDYLDDCTWNIGNNLMKYKSSIGFICQRLMNDIKNNHIETIKCDKCFTIYLFTTAKTFHYPEDGKIKKLTQILDKKIQSNINIDDKCVWLSKYGARCIEKQHGKNVFYCYKHHHLEYRVSERKEIDVLKENISKVRTIMKDRKFLLVNKTQILSLASKNDKIIYMEMMKRSDLMLADYENMLITRDDVFIYKGNDNMNVCKYCK